MRIPVRCALLLPLVQEGANTLQTEQLQLGATSGTETLACLLACLSGCSRPAWNFWVQPTFDGSLHPNSRQGSVTTPPPRCRFSHSGSPALHKPQQREASRESPRDPLTQFSLLLLVLQERAKSRPLQHSNVELQEGLLVVQEIRFRGSCVRRNPG